MAHYAYKAACYDIDRIKYQELVNRFEEEEGREHDGDSNYDGDNWYIMAMWINELRAKVAELESRASPASVPAWTHSCNALCIDGLELWIPQCPHCGKPAPTPPVSEDRWLPIETAPKETTQMFVVVAFGAKVGATPYNSDPWCVWHQRGEFVRWPHKFSPTHWMPLPEAPTMQEDKP